MLASLSRISSAMGWANQAARSLGANPTVTTGIERNTSGKENFWIQTNMDRLNLWMPSLIDKESRRAAKRHTATAVTKTTCIPSAKPT